MNLSAPRRRAAAVAVTLLAATTPWTLGSAPAAAAAPALALETTQSTVTLTRYDDGSGQGYVEGDLGVHVVARAEAFEVRAKRTGYDSPVVLTRVRPGEDQVLATAPDLTGLPRFWDMTIATATGRTVARSTAGFCPNAFEQVRRHPDAPASSPYPQGCFANPYSLGSVFGVQAGYAVPALTDAQAFAALPPGTYTVTLAITEAYRARLGLTQAQARSKVAVRLVRGELEEEPFFAARSARAGLRAAAAGPLGRPVRPSGPLPDLRSLPAWGIGVEDGRHLVFAATVWNAGPGRLVVDGFRTAYDPDLMRAYQYFFSADGKQQGYAPAGSMQWDARDGHDHWHFTDFATYRLLDARKRVAVRSGKEAFCLANTDVVDYTVPGANWRPTNTDLHTSCGHRGSLGVRQVLDTGSGDTYAQYLPGQSFDLQGLPNGTYYVEVRANPDRRLYESTTKNNASLRKVVVGGSPGRRTVTAERIGMVDETAFLGGGESAHVR